MLRHPAARTRMTVTLLLASLFATLVAVAAPGVQPAAAAGVRWFDGVIRYSEIINCPSIIQGEPYTEAGAGAYVGYASDPETAQPAINQAYYVRVAVAAIGSTCSGQLADLNLKLPPNTAFALDAGPIRCYVGNTQLNSSRCPSAPTDSSGSYGPGFFRFRDQNTQYGGLWPLPSGGLTLRIEVPVRSSTILSGGVLEGRVGIADGNSSPTLAPTQGVYVFNPGGSGTPSILHESPSTVIGGTTWPTTLRSAGFLYRNGTTGTAYLDLFTAPSGGSPVFTDTPVAIGSDFPAYEVYTDWTISPGNYPAQIQAGATLYWELRYQPSGGGVYRSPTRQSFTVPPAPGSVVGTGTPASCTSQSFQNALAFTSAGKTITFSCGPSPVEIPLAGQFTISTDVTIDGGGKVTFRAAPSSRAFRVQANATMKNLRITGGAPTGAVCGGGIWLSSGLLTLDAVQIVGNTADKGGGICATWPTGLQMTRSTVADNTAVTDGGGIWAGTYGGGPQKVDIEQSDLSGNDAGARGGAIHSEGQVEIDRSTFAGNSAPGGGAIRALGANGGLLVERSTFSGNTAEVAAAISTTQSAGASVRGSTITANTTTLAGRGAIESNTSIDLINTALGPNAGQNCASDVQFRQLATSSAGGDGFNLDSGTSCALAGGSGNVSNANPQFLPLAYWGGTTRTHAVPAGSPLIDKGSNGVCGAADQRGLGGAGVRQVDGDGVSGAQCDIGAVEYLPEAAAPIVASVVRTSANPTSGNSVAWTVGFSETVTGVDAGDFSLVQSGVAGSSIASVTPSAPSSTFTVTANVGTGVGTLRLDVAANGTVRDVANNALAAGFAGTAYDVNKPTGGGGGGGASGFSPVTPVRLFDTRPGEPQGLIQVTQQQYGGANILRVKVAGVAGLPSNGVGAVSMNVTVAGPVAPGYVTVFPCGLQPLAANLNFVAGQVVPNAVIAPVSPEGDVCFFSNVNTHLIADLNGWFPTGGGFNAVTPTRVFDTRTSEAQGAVQIVQQQYGGANILRVRLTNVAGVPASGVGAISLNVTVANPALAGYVTVFPCGPQPLAANLNFVAGQVVPNAVIAPVSPEGDVCFFSNANTDLIADVNGWFGVGAGFTALTPARLFDTRPTEAQGAVSIVQQQYGGANILRVKVTGAAGVPGAGVGAVSMNVTVAGPVAAGYATVFPCGPQPLAANLNFVAGQVVPNAVIAPVSPEGEVCFFSNVNTHLIADVNGWFAS